MMDAIKGTMTEIYNDLSKNTTGSTIAEVSGSWGTPSSLGLEQFGAMGNWTGTPLGSLAPGTWLALWL